ncbi:hypothetical protein HZH68_015505 [Vespula germanica]|uniref:Uncharacterized protein n=1 Tax=Vespula germanica TaxID=30212 RepID=A0A834J7M0_VESGE|nr:hypothetical protein HZH68_015505 [Vespula germanica]
MIFNTNVVLKKKSDEVINITNNEGDTKLREDKRLFVIAVGLSTACFTIDEIKTEWKIHAIQMKYVVFPLIMDHPYIKVAYMAFKGAYIAYRILYLQTSIEKLTGYQCGYVTSVRILTINLIIDGIKAKIRIHTVQIFSNDGRQKSNNINGNLVIKEEIVIKQVDSIIFSKKNAKRSLQQIDYTYSVEMNYNTGGFDTSKLSTTSSIPSGTATTAGSNVINVIIDENKHHNNSSIL